MLQSIEKSNEISVFILKLPKAAFQYKSTKTLNIIWLLFPHSHVYYTLIIYIFLDNLNNTNKLNFTCI